MAINQVNDAESWRKLLAYYIDCLREENRLRYVIKPKDIKKTCFFLPSIRGDFLRKELQSLVLTHSSRKQADSLQRFVLGDPTSSKRPSVSFGYPFFIDSDRQLMPLLYVKVSGTRIDGGVGLTRESVEIEVNFAAIWEALPSDKEIGLDELFARFDALEVKSGESRFDQTLALLVSQLKEVSGLPVERIGPDKFDPGSTCHAVVECPLLFRVTDRYTNQLLRELNQLLKWHDWNEVQPALSQLLTQTVRIPYPEVPELVADPRLYVVDANDSQRKAVAAASQCPVTVVTGPPGTGKSQLIVNIVGDAVLKGEMVLIASRNNQAVDVVSDRFLGQVNYRGAVRTGKREFRQRLPIRMQQDFSIARRGGLTSRMEQVCSQYDELLHQIDLQRKTISDIRHLMDDQLLYRAEIRDLVNLLPEWIGKSVGKVQIRLGDDESPKLTAALRNLIEDTETLIERREALVEEIKADIVENREGLALFRQVEALDRRLAIAFDDMRQGISLECFADIEESLTAWESLVTALSLQAKVYHLRDKVTDAQHQAQEVQKGLPADLVTELDAAVDLFDSQQEHMLRQSLEDLQQDVYALLESYNQLVEGLTSIVERSAAERHLLKLMGERRAEDPVAPQLDLTSLGKVFAIKDDVLYTHGVGIIRADLQQQLRALEREKTDKLAEFDSMLADLEGQAQAARAEVPATLITHIETAAKQGNHKMWQDMSIRLSQLDEWCNRVRNDQLTPVERLHRAISRDWALNRIRRGLDALEPSLADWAVLDPMDKPTDDAPFYVWGDYIRDWTCFARACSSVARWRYVGQQREAYCEQIEREIETQSTELREADERFMDALTGLPGTIADSMLDSTWPFEPIDSSLIRELETVQDQYSVLAPQYTVVMERLIHLQQGHTAPEYLRAAIRASRLGDVGEESVASRGQVTSSAVVELLNAWLQFSHAIEAAQELRLAQKELAEAEGTLEKVVTRLPAKVRQEVDSTAVQYSDEIVQPTRAALSTLKTELAKQTEEWRNLRERASGLLQRNTLEIRALSKALKHAKKDSDYLAGLIGRKTYEHPQQLLDDLKPWKLVVRVWDTMSQLSEVSKRLKGYPDLDKVRAQLDHLVKERQTLAGQVLSEQWRQTATELKPETMQSIQYYLDAVQALTGDAGPSFRTLKEQAERHFADALKLFPVWSTTNLSTQDLPLRAGLFDYVIIDEASQCDIPSALPLLFRAKRIVIIGDDKQLRHIATLPKRVHRQLSERYTIGTHYSYTEKSLFHLADDSTIQVPGRILLDEHYRSHGEIIEFSNQNFYEGDLKVRPDLSRVPPIYQTRGCGVYWIDVRGQAERPGPGQIFNRREEQIVTDVVRRLLKQLDSLGMTDTDIGIVTPFRAQSDNIQKAIKRLPIPEGRVLVGTVHTYQGNERHIMIFSTVATGSLPPNSFRFMADNPNLLNVAVTRARLTLIVIGDHGFFMGLPKNSCYHKLAAYAKDLGKVHANLEKLPLFQPVTDEDRPFELGKGIATRKDSPYSNRMTLRQLLASCQDYLWWYDPYMSINALDALALALSGLEGQTQEIRLLTSEMFWENQREEPLCITKKRILPLKREMEARGIKLQLAVTSYDPDNPPPHDRYLFSANQSVNMPPIKNIYQNTARLAEFLPSTVKPEEFESWWQEARVIFE